MPHLPLLLLLACSRTKSTATVTSPPFNSLLLKTPKYALERSSQLPADKALPVMVSSITSAEVHRYTNTPKMGNSLPRRTPLQGYDVAANHIGDIDVFENELYLSIEWFVDGQGKDIQIAVHDADTLQFKRSFPFERAPDSEVSGIAVDRDSRQIWMSSWVGGDSEAPLPV